MKTILKLITRGWHVIQEYQNSGPGLHELIRSRGPEFIRLHNIGADMFSSVE